MRPECGYFRGAALRGLGVSCRSQYAPRSVGGQAGQSGTGGERLELELHPHRGSQGFPREGGWGCTGCGPRSGRPNRRRGTAAFSDTFAVELLGFCDKIVDEIGHGDKTVQRNLHKNRNEDFQTLLLELRGFCDKIVDKICRSGQKVQWDPYGGCGRTFVSNKQPWVGVRGLGLRLVRVSKAGSVVEET
jgi:hypothetical protein